MARIKRAQNRKTRTKKLFKRSKGFFGARGTTRRQTNEAVLHALDQPQLRSWMDHELPFRSVAFGSGLHLQG